RCVFHYIEFPNPDLMEAIVRVHFPDLEQEMLRTTMQRFYDLRNKDQLQKRPSTSELIDWIFVLLKGGVAVEQIATGLPFLGVLLKKESDVDMIQKGGRFRFN